jgi:PTS system N-acetylgalactosamine-specific IIA component
MTSSSGPRRAVVAGHGDFARGLVSAVQQISGKGDVFETVSNAALGADTLADAISAAASARDVRVIFTDLPAGSCTIAARRVARENPLLAVVTGANLAMLLDYALKGEATTAALDLAVDKGRQAMQVVHASEAGGAS